MLTKNNFLISLSSYFFYLIPLALLTGPFLPDLIISTLVIIFIYISIISKQKKYFINKFFYFYFIFCAYLIICSLFSKYIIFSLESSLFYFRFGIFALATWFLIDNKKNFIKEFTIVLTITFIVVIFDGYFQYLNGQSIFGISNISPSRLNLLLDDKKILGGYLARLFPLLIGLLIYSLSSKLRNYFFIGLLLILTDTLVYISGERTALGLLLLSTILIIFLISKYKYLRIITLFISISIILIISFLNPDIKERNIDKTINELGLNPSSQKLNLYSPIHENMILGAYKIFLDHKLIGSGPNTFRKLCGHERYNVNNMTCSTHPHNIYVQLAAETGIIGLSIIIVLFLFIVYQILKHLILTLFTKKGNLSDYQICLFAAVFLTLFPFLPSNNFFNNWINIVYFLPVGFLLHSFQKNDLKKKSSA